MRDGAEVARWAHNPKVIGSNPIPATNISFMQSSLYKVLLSKIKNKIFSVFIEDSTGQKLTFISFFFKTSVLSGIFKKFLSPHRVGLLLPNTSSFPIVFFALSKIGKLPVIFNYKSSLRDIIFSAKASSVSTIVTSRFFEKKANLTDLMQRISNDGLNIIYIEDLLRKINFFSKVKFILQSLISPDKIEDEDSPAVILFTSGSEGTPKAVVLSIKNILSNVSQIETALINDLDNKDIFFSSLPFFHSFGLLGGLFFPMKIGAKIYIYHSPLDYKIIPKKIKETKSTVFFSTNTFLLNCSNYASKEDFSSLTYVVGGAEKIQEETISIYKQKFDIIIYEGYGLTEASPVVSVSTPDLYKKNSVGKPLKDIEVRIEKVEGYNNGGKLFIKGPNIMLGYYLSSNPDELTPPPNGWHDTGDIVDCDMDGFIYIKGRFKRFAKISGEMISLGAIEEIILEKNSGFINVAVSIPDKIKGEKIIIVTNNPELTNQDIRSLFLQKNINSLMIPSDVLYFEEIPILANGKVDFTSVANSVEKII